MTYISALAGSLLVPAVLIGLVAGVRQKAVDVVVQNQTANTDGYCVTCPNGLKIRVERPCKANAAWWGLMTATLAPHGLADLATYGLYVAGAPVVGAVAPLVTLAALGAAGAGAVNKLTADMDEKCADLKFYFDKRENFFAIDMVLSSPLPQTDKAKLQEACLDRKEALTWQGEELPWTDIRVAPEDIVMGGTLEKQSQHNKVWASRYIALTQTHLYSFREGPGGGAELKELKNPSDLVVRVADILEVKDADETNDASHFQVVTEKRTFSLAADTPDVKKKWVEVVRRHLLQGPTYPKLKQCMTHESLCGEMLPGESPTFGKIDENCPAKDDTIRVAKEDIVKEGILQKLSQHKGKWASRFIVLTRTHLYSFREGPGQGAELKNPTDLVVRVADILEVKDADETNDALTFQVVTNKRIFSLAADTLDVKKKWVEVVSRHLPQGSASE